MAKYLINGHSHRFQNFTFSLILGLFVAVFLHTTNLGWRLDIYKLARSWSISSFVFSHSQICHSWLFSLWTGFVYLDSAFIGKRLGTHSTMGRKQWDKHDIEDVTPKKWQENNTKLHFSLTMQTKNLLVLRKGFVRTHARRAPFPARPEYIFLLRLFEKIFSDHSKASLVIRGL